MATKRFVVLGLARPRTPWFSDVGRWASAGTAPLEFVKCVSPEEVRARLAGGQVFSALLLDGSHSGADRDLIDCARNVGTATFVVHNGGSRDWIELGAASVLAADFGQIELLGALEVQASAVDDVTRRDAAPHPLGQDGAGTGSRYSGRLVAVTGGGGSGRSLIAMGLAQALADDPRHQGHIVLADLCLRSGQGMLHDATDVVPSVTELVDSFRSGSPSPATVRGMTFEIGERGYDLLLGLRRRRDWAALRPRAVAAALAGLLTAYRWVIADTDDDLEGELQGGSVEVEERNILARTSLGTADVVVATGRADLPGIHGLVHTLHELSEFGIDAKRVVPVLTLAPRSPRARAGLTTALAELAPTARERFRLAAPVFIPELRRVAAALSDGGRLPSGLARNLASAVVAAADATTDNTATSPSEPARIQPGSLGQFAQQHSD